VLLDRRQSSSHAEMTARDEREELALHDSTRPLTPASAARSLIETPAVCATEL
jgi:hypothetical protein